jgi:Concanavalin A-like lectin/glucanases superfamily
VHIACTFSGGTAKVYVNDVLKTTLTGITYTPFDIFTPLRLGIPSEAASSNVYAGTLEKVQVYHRALTASEITTLYQNP